MKSNDVAEKVRELVWAGRMQDGKG